MSAHPKGEMGRRLSDLGRTNMDTGGSATAAGEWMGGESEPVVSSAAGGTKTLQGPRLAGQPDIRLHQAILLLTAELAAKSTVAQGWEGPWAPKSPKAGGNYTKQFADAWRRPISCVDQSGGAGRADPLPKANGGRESGSKGVSTIFAGTISNRGPRQLSIARPADAFNRRRENIRDLARQGDLRND